MSSSNLKKGKCRFLEHARGLEREVGCPLDHCPSNFHIVQVKKVWFHVNGDECRCRWPENEVVDPITRLYGGQ